MTLELIYFANPMCSWCYGFHAGFEEVLEARAGAVSVTVGLGALREDTEPLRDDQKRYLRDAWTRVAAMSGRPFDFALLERDDFAYDTRPASVAVAALRAAQPSAAMTFLGAVETAFYRDNRDVTQAAVLAAIAREHDLDAAPIAAAVGDDDALASLRHENEQVAGLGVTGYPTVLALTRPKPQVVTIGFQPPETVAETLDGLIARAA